MTIVLFTWYWIVHEVQQEALDVSKKADRTTYDAYDIAAEPNRRKFRVKK